MKNSNLSNTICCIFLLLFTFQTSNATDKLISLTSPDKRTEMKISISENIRYSVLRDGKVLITPSSISMTLNNGEVLGAKPQVSNLKSNTVNRTINTFYGTNSEVQDNYNELVIKFKNNYSVSFRAYNNGVAYRFLTNINSEIIIKNEEASFNFSNDPKAYFIMGKKEDYLYEENYLHLPISKIDSGRVAILPINIELDKGPMLSITESDLIDYPGMYLSATGNNLQGSFRHYPLKFDFENTYWSVSIKENADYIAKTNGVRSFPWRVIMISETEKELLKNELVYLLASEQKKETDFSWVKPGKIINDWWDAIWVPETPQEVILSGVDFKSGTNFDTYKYYIDFAVQHHIEFVNVDYGWCDPLDFSKIHPNLDLQKLLKYSKEKNKKIILWCVARTLYKNLDENMEMFEKWGVSGLKVDFFERDDQQGINDYIRIADEAARHHLVLEYHGATKPTGLSRMYPNLLTYEAVLGSESDKSDFRANPIHDVTIPFMRGVSGPFDYGPGAMFNASKRSYFPVADHPMSQGTRCHQLAMYVIYYSPLQFMVDVPTNYNKEPECLDFLASIPTVWDATNPLESKIGQYITIARKKNDTWFVGSMTNWDERTLKIKCDFLDKKDYQVEIFQDGLNANLNGMDYKRNVATVKQNDVLTIHLAQGGGWAAKFIPVEQ
ncbi:glycoside hydrolase family 97 protein [Flavihumibacter profundi]|jgi:alpha-glucosidase|uniref:glycoside hydrolase family 97 protein n=1 Tax=Flavihumibacter profundi TaxID=2716883 RepID=UPI001CC57B51|nr:glycoside hydrolase family 97 protein [Flavihumibacter profundi]MBZ5856605.1 glycoside hydrolase family 97 protein [Flavihumibacter profundi]